MVQRFSLRVESFWEVLDLAETKTKSPMDQLLEEDQMKKISEKVITLESKLADAKKQLSVQSNMIKVLARKINQLEEKEQ